MRFLLSFLLFFVCVFANAQETPPMKLGGPQGIEVNRSLNKFWMSVPIYVDTPVAPLTGSGWPGSGYIIQASKNYRNATVEQWLQYIEAGGFTQLDSIRWQDNAGTIYFLPKGIDTSQVLDYALYGDTSLWHYTGRTWRRTGGNSEFYFNYLLDGGNITQVSPVSSRQFIISPAEYYISGVKYKYDTAFRLQAPSKAADSTGRIDVITIASTGPRLTKGTPSRTPYKPRINSDEIELSTIYFRPFDTIPSVIGGSGGSAISSIYRLPGKDSIYYTIDTITFKLKDSVGLTTASNGLTASNTNVKLGGSLIENTNINLSSRRLSIIAGSDTTRFFTNGGVSIGGSALDSLYKLNVNGSAMVRGILRTTVSSLNNASVIMNGNNIASNEASLVWGSNGLNLPSNTGIRNVVISPVGAYSSLTGEYNTFIGRGAGVANSSGNWNVLVGADAGNGITNGIGNTIIGSTLNAVSPNYSRTIQLISGGYENNRPDSSLAGLTQTFAFIGGGDDGQVSNQPSYINDYYFGGGHRIRLARFGDVNFYAPSAQVRTDSVGANFTINAGRGTGTGLGGSVIFRTSSHTTSGTTLQTLSERARITPAGNLLIGTASDSIFRLDVNGLGRLQTALQINRNGGEATVVYSNNNVNFAQVRGIGTSGISISDAVGSPVWRFYNTQTGFGSGDVIARQIGKWNVSGTISGPTQYPAIFAQNINLQNDSSLVEVMRVQSQFNGGQIRNGYGPSITFYVRDTDTLDNRIADISAVRLNSDSSGGIVFGVQNANSRFEAARITNNRNLLVGTTTDNNSAIVNIESTTKGFLPPRMTGAQAELISSPAEGLMIYSTNGNGTTITSKGWWGFDGSTWVKLN